MISKEEQEQFNTLIKSKFNSKELDWINSKTAIISETNSGSKFGVFFSLASRFINNEQPVWDKSDLEKLEKIYPGFENASWSKLNMARVLLMTALDISVNKKILINFFEIAEMKEQTSLYKGLYVLLNASEFEGQYAEGIRTNMVNVFDAIACGNPFAKAYLQEDAWNQLVLKSLFLDRKLYTIQGIDQGKNENLANMLQDFVKERWAAGRQVSFEIWRMIEGYLRNDVKELFSNRTFKGTEKEIIEKLLNQNHSISTEYWDSIGKIN